MRVLTLPLLDVAVMLRIHLGPQRAWDDFLTDCTRGKTTFHGLVLLPVGYIVRKGLPRPAYLKEEVLAFIRDARTVAPPPPNKTKGWQVDIVELGPGDDRRAWRHRVLTPVPL